MPAGDLVTQNYQMELRATLMGRGADVHFNDEGGGVTGLFDDRAEAVETPYLHASGSFVGGVRQPSRLVVASLLVVGETEDAVGNTVVALRTAWAKDATEPPPEVALWFQWPGFGKRYVRGHPLGLVVPDFTKALILRRVPVVGEFLLSDPTIYTP